MFYRYKGACFYLPSGSSSEARSPVGYEGDDLSQVVKDPGDVEDVEQSGCWMHEDVREPYRYGLSVPAV